MEVENDGFGELSAIDDLVAAINAESDSDYAFVNFNAEKIGTDDITTAIIYRKDVVKRLARQALQLTHHLIIATVHQLHRASENWIRTKSSLLQLHT